MTDGALPDRKRLEGADRQDQRSALENSYRPNPFCLIVIEAAMKQGMTLSVFRGACGTEVGTTLRGSDTCFVIRSLLKAA
jgi:hypothetical protein